MLRTIITIWMLAGMPLLTLAENAPPEKKCQAHEFFFRDFFLDPWQSSESATPSQWDNQTEAEIKSETEEVPAPAIAPPTSPDPQEPIAQAPSGSRILLLLAGATLLLLIASGRLQQLAEKGNAWRLRWAKNRKLKRLRKKYHQQEEIPEFRQALKDALELPPGATDQDLLQALQEYGQEWTALLKTGYDRFR